MKTIARIGGRGSILAAALIAGSMLSVAPARAQDDRAACHCVDAAGEVIEDCTCFRAPRVDRLLSEFRARSNQARLGISVEMTQPAPDDAEGARVSDVLDGGPADEAGIREGDVITRIGGRALTEAGDARDERDFDLDRSIPVQRLLAELASLDPGDDVEVTFLRDGREQTAEVGARVLTSWGTDFTVAMPRWNAEGLQRQLRGLTDGEVHARLDDHMAPTLFRLGSHRDGLDLVEVNPSLGSYFDAERGVLVTDVARNSTLGLEPGDVVLEIGTRAVTTPERFRSVLSTYGPDEDIDFQIVRQGIETTVSGRLRY